jgi:hypothetical protein
LAEQVYGDKGEDSEGSAHMVLLSGRVRRCSLTKSVRDIGIREQDKLTPAELIPVMYNSTQQMIIVV